MRLFILAALLLVGCSSGKAPIPPQPDSPTDGGVVNKVGAELDKVDGRVAAAVTVARANADKADVVRAETTVALAYLPKPSEADVAYAEKRAAANDEKAYAEAVAYGKKLLARLDASWASMEAQQKEAARISALKDKRIQDLSDEVVRVKQEAARSTWTLTGAGLVVAGALACAFASVRYGIPLMMAGAFAAAVPHVLESTWFPWVAGSAVVIFAGIGLFLFWERFRKKPIDEATGEPPSNP